MVVSEGSVATSLLINKTGVGSELECQAVQCWLCKHCLTVSRLLGMILDSIIQTLQSVVLRSDHVHPEQVVYVRLCQECLLLCYLLSPMWRWHWGWWISDTAQKAHLHSFHWIPFVIYYLMNKMDYWETLTKKNYYVILMKACLDMATGAGRILLVGSIAAVFFMSLYQPMCCWLNINKVAILHF